MIMTLRDVFSFATSEIGDEGGNLVVLSWYLRAPVAPAVTKRLAR
jgi:hypothetical protein